MTIVFAVLLHCLVGVLFLLTYLIAMKPPERQTLLGLIVMFWPVWIIVELVFALASQFGKTAIGFRNRISKVV